MKYDSNYWKGVAERCETLADYERATNTPFENMMTMQVVGWLLAKGDTVTKDTVEQCLKADAFGDTDSEWWDALKRAARAGESLYLSVVSTEDGEDDKFLPFFLP